MKPNIEEFETKIKLRTLTNEDYEAVVELQKACFPNMLPWDKPGYESMLEKFPEGQIGIEIDEELIASSSSLIVDYDLYSDWHDWVSIASNGKLEKHNPNGDMLYGIEIMVHPEYRGMKLARRLYEARKEIVRERNLEGIVIGGRIPGYAKYKSEMTPHEYVAKVTNRELYDPVFTTQISNGFELKRLLEDYLPSDEDSAGWATHMEWTNLDYQPFKKRSIRPVQIVRLATVQYQMRAIQSFEDMVHEVDFYVSTAADYHADFVLFPELFTTQLMSFSNLKNPYRGGWELSKYTPQYIEMFADLAIRYNINIIGGSQFVEQDGKLYNIAFFFRRDGSIEEQYKLHVTPAEYKWWGVQGGSKLNVFDTDSGRVAILICYDMEFPELARIAVAKGAQIIFCPFNTDERNGYQRIRYSAIARCIENHIYTAIAGCTGNLPKSPVADIHYSQTGIYTPSDICFARDGIAAESTPNVETLLIQDLDLELLRRHRYTGTTKNWLDRRKDLYELVYKDDEGEHRI